MTKPKHLILFIFLCCQVHLLAQANYDTLIKLKKNKTIHKFKGKPSPYLLYGVSFYSHYFLKPGFEFSVLKNLKSKSKIIYKTKKNKEILRVKNLNLTLNNSYYFHLQNHHAVRLYSTIRKEVLFAHKLHFSYGLSLGMLRSFLGETYEVTDDGAVKERSWYGRFYGTFGGLLEVAYPFDISKKINFILFLSSEFYSQFPYNNLVSWNFNNQIGVKFNIKKNE